MIRHVFIDTVLIFVRGLKLAHASPDKQLKKDCAAILDNLKVIQYIQYVPINESCIVVIDKFRYY